MSPEILQEYEYERVGDCYQMMQKVVPRFTVGIVLLCSTAVATGNNSLANALTNAAPVLITCSALHIFKCLERPSVRRDGFLCGIALQIVAFFGAMTIRSVSATVDYTLVQHRNYFMFFVVFAFFQPVLGYLPDVMFHYLVCPYLFVSWAVYHIKIGQFTMNVVMLGILVPLMMGRVRGALNATSKQNFLTARELVSVRKSLEEVMSAQQSVLGTFFDASCVCDDQGSITEAPPQMKELMACVEDTLVGTPFANLAPPDEQIRLRDFLDNTWKSGVAAVAMMETSLRRATAEVSEGAPAPTGSTFAAKIHCIRLPGARVATESMKLWAHGGMFLGLQEVSSGTAPGESCQACLGVQGEEHEIVFDAGTTSLQVVGCSPLFSFAGLGSVTCGLHDMLPSRVVQWMDEFVVGEVQSDSLGERTGQQVLQGLSLKLPPSPGMRLEVRSAQLKFQGLDDVDAEIPVALRLSGLKLASARRSAARRGRLLAGMEGIQEGDSASAPEENASDAGGSETADETSTLWPDDSMSQWPMDDSLSLQSGRP